MSVLGEVPISQRGGKMTGLDLREGPGTALAGSARGSPGPGRVATVAIAAAKVSSAPDSVRHRLAPNVGDSEGVEGGVRALWLVRCRRHRLARINKGGAAALSRAGRKSAAADPAPRPWRRSDAVANAAMARD